MKEYVNINRKKEELINLIKEELCKYCKNIEQCFFIENDLLVCSIFWKIFNNINSYIEKNCHECNLGLVCITLCSPLLTLINRRISYLNNSDIYDDF